VPLRDPQALARGIVELLDCTERRESLARSAQAFAQTYNADWTCAQFEALYQQVVQRRGDIVEYASAS
jgi:glycosyltransferase involved in cell wall biosynthesis